MHETIAQILLRVKAVSLSPNKPFTFASGIQSPIYCDNRILLSYPTEREIIVHSFLKLIKKNKLECDTIAGTATAGIPWAAWISTRLRKPLVYVRSEAKKHGKQNLIEGIVKKNDKILVVEDLVSSGSSSINSVNALRDKKAIIKNVISIFTYNMKKSKRLFQTSNVNVLSLCTLDQLIQVSLKTRSINQKEANMILHWRNNH